jgi:N6-L-threonylcarbamoyladenine synthase
MSSTTWVAFETSCDETSVAVGREGTVLANLVSSQVELHSEFGGVVPELAAREHLRNLPRVAAEAMAQARVSSEAVDFVAATQGPGLPGALMVGFKAAQAMAYALGRPCYGIHHHEAHLYSPWIDGEPPRARFEEFQPNVALVVSGGHTLLVRVKAEFDHEVLGSTCDDAAGECFDKVAKLIGLPYPGGPMVDRLATDGDPRRFSFPRPLLEDDSDDFSFSGLKTAVRYFLRDHPELLEDGQGIRDLCAGVQAAIVEVLVTKTVRVAKRLGIRSVTASGGVTCNSAFRRHLQEACEEAGLALRLAARALSTDNAAMVGVVAERRHRLGLRPTGYEEDIRLGWSLV